MATNDSPLSVAASRALVLPLGSGTGPVPDGSTIWGDYVTVATPTADLFRDDFSSGDLSKTVGSAGWGSQRATSLVNGDGCVVFSSGGSVVDPPSCGFDDREWEAIEGDNSLRFRFPGGSDFPMQTWSLGQPATRQRSICMGLRIRVPNTYRHVNNSGSSTNNKFLALWMDGRETNSDGGATVVFQTRERGSNDGSSFVVYCWNSADGFGDFASFTDFISVPTSGGGQRDDRGRWMDLKLQVAANAEDDTTGEETPGTGTVEVWRRWQDEAEFSQIMSATRDIPWPNSGYDGWDTLQIIGGDNSHLDEGIEWLLDKFEFASFPLVPAGTEGL